MFHTISYITLWMRTKNVDFLHLKCGVISSFHWKWELFLISSPACELGNSGITRNHQTYFCRWKDKCVTTWYLLPQLHALHSGKPIWSFAFTPVQRGPNELATGGCKLLPFNSILGVGSWEISFTPLKKRRSASRYRSNWPCSHFSYKFVPFFHKSWRISRF